MTRIEAIGWPQPVTPAWAEVLAAHPQADRQQLRQLIRNTREERAKSKPPRAFRELFRELRELLAQDEGADSGETDEPESPPSL